MVAEKYIHSAAGKRRHTDKIGVMAYKDENMPALFAPHLQPGEQLVNWAYGVKQPNIFIILIAVLTLNILTYILTKHYVVGMTNMGRVIVLQMGGGTVKAVQPYVLGQVSGVRTSTGPIFTHISIAGPVPWVAKFHRMGMKQNREHSQAIAAALQQHQLAA